GLERTVAPRNSKVIRNVQAAVKEVVKGRGVFFLSQRISLSYRHHLGKAGAIGIVVPTLFLDHIPVDLHNLRGTLIAKVAEVGIVVVKVGTEVPGLDRPAPRNPDGRIGFL